MSRNMKIFPKLYLNNKFEIVEVGDEVTAVSVGGDVNSYNGVIILKNESTKFMFEKIQEGITMPELIKECMDKYTDSTIDEIGPQVIAFLDMLDEKNLLLADPQNGITLND